MTARKQVVVAAGDIVAAMVRLTEAITALDQNLSRLRAGAGRRGGARQFPDLSPERRLSASARNFSDFIPDPPEAREFLPLKGRRRPPE